MKYRTLSVIVAGGFVLALSVIALQAAEAPRMDKDKVKAELGTGKMIVIDVRAPQDWAGSDKKIKGATREDPEKVDQWAGKYPKDKILLFYCA